MFGLLPLAQRVEFFRRRADFGLERVGGVGEGEGVEDAGFGIARIVSDPEPSAGAQSPNDVKA